ncbi:hypothetical protein [Sulfitobacter sp. W074]|uniref:hypothetical protein n=1 Tax=Sulfitobacter sp. W074 TaxID=2867026 RepID=UPI0021A28789|nr:hypothetical protein [Sulfitobacter sp. W074]UWR39427.1 hypothetical protein K3762_18905 [Sulfitobacter sp. W074]
MSDVIRFPRSLRSTALAVSGLTEAEDAPGNFKMSDLYGRVREDAAVDDASPEPDTNVSFLQQPSSLPAPVTGWSNQELADLYRTQRILALAGVTTQVDRGVTDEGDPWFVFMDSQDEVLVHFSRFDGAYMVTSQMQDAPIRGDSLQDLVAEFSRRVKPVTQAGQLGQNVVSIAKRNRDVVFIHPAAALAALVWSIYLMSDELIAATSIITAGEAEDVGLTSVEKGAVGDLDPVADHANELPPVAQKAALLPADQDLTKQGAIASSSRESLALGFSGHGAKAIGASLSLVALAVGLPLPASNALEVADENGALQKLNLASLSAALTQVKAKEAALLVASEVTQLQQREIDAAAPPDSEGEAETSIIETTADTPAAFEAVQPTHSTKITILSTHAPEVAPSSMARDDVSAQALESTKRMKEVTPASSADTAGETVKEISFLQSFDAAFESFEITSLDKIAETELTQLFDPEDTKDTPNPLSPIQSIQGFETFDQDARVFLDFLLHTYSNIKVVNLATEIIFIHMDAFEGNDSAHEIYAKSWSFDDGGTVSTIGFKSDMAQFDLIA